MEKTRVKFSIQTVQKDGHHRYVIVNKKKIPLLDDGVVYLYKDKYGLLHATDWTDVAGSKTGEFIMTNEVQEQGGLPAIGGEPFTVWGATETYLYLTANKKKDARKHFKEETVKEDGEIKTIVPRGDKQELAKLELLAGLYCEFDK